MANKGTRGWGDFRCDDVGERRKTKVDGEEEFMYLPFTTLFVSEVSSNEVLPLTEADWPFSNSSSPSTFVFLLSPTSSHLKSPQPLVPRLMRLQRQTKS
jgi:hypothetical protein